MPPEQRTRIEVRGLDAYYGESHVLQGVDLTVHAGEITAILGRNGAGKTTLLRAIMGTVVTRKGVVLIDGRRVDHLSAYKIARLGVGYVPEERGIFSSLSVQENLLLPPVLKAGGMSVDEIYRLFPNLRERSRSQGTKLSGGEQQMLATARVLRTGADIVLLDEPTEGLAPVIVDQIEGALHELKRRAFTVVLVEQNLTFALEVADRYLVMDEGRVVDFFDRVDAAAKIESITQYLSL
ncbi:MAG: ABC transporter ATP-binding protein [Burkholderiaceae bacterium]|nr:ABC transporter ATP-binding protein [Burkholderiaceae bacterium]